MYFTIIMLSHTRIYQFGLTYLDVQTKFQTPKAITSGRIASNPRFLYHKQKDKQTESNIEVVPTLKLNKLWQTLPQPKNKCCLFCFSFDPEKLKQM